MGVVPQLHFGVEHQRGCCLPAFLPATAVLLIGTGPLPHPGMGLAAGRCRNPCLSCARVPPCVCVPHVRGGAGGGQEVNPVSIPSLTPNPKTLHHPSGQCVSLVRMALPTRPS